MRLTGMGKEADQLRGEGVSRDGIDLGGETSQ
jgi:hypothetical protein